MKIRPIDGKALEEQFRQIGALNSEFFAEQTRKAPTLTTDVLSCGGFKMFRGKMEITVERNALLSRTIEGTWLYLPDDDVWMCSEGNRQFSSQYCRIIE